MILSMDGKDYLLVRCYKVKEEPMIKEIPDPEKEVERVNEQRIQKTKVFIVFDNVTGNIMEIYFDHEKAKVSCEEMRENRKNYPNENYVVLEWEVK